MRAAQNDRHIVLDRPVVLAAACAFGVLALANMWPYVAIEPHPRAFPADFNPLWGAGKAWIDGRSPYLDYHAQALDAADAPHLHDDPPPYFYPPATIVVFGPLGILSLGAASFVWSIVTFASLIASSVFFAALCAAATIRRRIVLFMAHLGVVGLGWDAADVIGAHNNGDFFFYAAFTAALLGAARAASGGGSVLFVIALTVTLMRPQFGLVLWTAAMVVPSLRAGAIAAALATAALSLAGLWNEGLFAALRAFLANLSVYGAYPENAVQHTSGASFLAWATTGLDASPFLWASLAVVVSAFVASKVRAAAPVALLSATCAGLFLLPAHNTYYLAFTPALLLFSGRSFCAATMLFGGLLLMKTWTLARALSDAGAGYLQLNSAAIDTLGAGLAAGGLLLLLADRAGAPLRSRARGQPRRTI